MLKNASFLAIVAVHTAENEPLKVWKKAEKWALCEAPELTALEIKHQFTSADSIPELSDSGINILLSCFT